MGWQEQQAALQAAADKEIAERVRATLAMPVPLYLVPKVRGCMHESKVNRQQAKNFKVRHISMQQKSWTESRHGVARAASGPTSSCDNEVA